MSVRVSPAMSDDWPDVERAFGRAARRPDSCWCQRFRRHQAPDHRTALRRELAEQDVPVGLIARLDGVPVGWTRVVPRTSLPGIVENRALRRLLEADDGGWWITCVTIVPSARGRGVGVAMLKGAVAHAFRYGAPHVDGHPVDEAALASTPSPAALFTGTLSMFRRAGFVEIGRTFPSRPVMRHASSGGLDPTGPRSPGKTSPTTDGSRP